MLSSFELIAFFDTVALVSDDNSWAESWCCAVAASLHSVL